MQRITYSYKWCNATTHVCDACATACATTLIHTWHKSTYWYMTQQHFYICDATTLTWWHSTYVMQQHICDTCPTACAARLIHAWHTQHLCTCGATTLICMWHMRNSVCNNTDSYEIWYLVWISDTDSYVTYVQRDTNSYVTYMQRDWFICDTHNAYSYVTQRHIYVIRDTSAQHVHSMCNNTDWYQTQQNWFICDICATTLIHMCDTRNTCSYTTQQHIYVTHVQQYVQPH